MDSNDLVRSDSDIVNIAITMVILHNVNLNNYL